MQKNANHYPPKVVIGSILIGHLTAVLGVSALNVAIRMLGVQWDGEVFGNGQFNWKDAALIMVGVIILIVVAPK